MSRILASVLFLMAWTMFVGQSAVAAEKAVKTEVPRDVQSVVQSNNEFAFNLYGKLRSEEGNLFFSPLSISTALAMTYAGAEGQTEEEMAGVLQFKLPEDQVHQAFTSLMSTLNTPEKDAYELRIANRLWGQTGYGFLPEFITTTRKEYAAEMAQVDFIKNADAARQQVNAWVAEQTKDKIKDLLPSGAVNELTRLVLTNAIYFKGKWQYPFDKKLTKEAPFTTASGAKVEVPLMVQKKFFKYGEDEDLQLLELPYLGDHLSMLILLPKQVDGLSALEEQLTAENVHKLSSVMRRQEVLTYVPRFKLTEQFQLNSMLSALGMPSAFAANKANFAGMNGKRDLFISAAIHKAFVDVNEEGTEAAAATGIVVGTTSVRPKPKQFRADHPFVFLILDSQTGSILFVGRVTNPAA